MNTRALNANMKETAPAIPKDVARHISRKKTKTKAQAKTIILIPNS